MRIIALIFMKYLYRAAVHYYWAETCDLHIKSWSIQTFGFFQILQKLHHWLRGQGSLCQEGMKKSLLFSTLQNRLMSIITYVLCISLSDTTFGHGFDGFWLVLNKKQVSAL